MSSNIKIPPFSYEEINEWFKYCEITGDILWKKKPAKKIQIGDIAGTPKDGYLVARLFQNNLHAHRISWMLNKGRWPSTFLDHINGVRNDNRVENLREVTAIENARNTKKHRQGKICGVAFEQGKWRARIAICGESINLGGYGTFEKALEKRKMAELIEAQVRKEIKERFLAALSAITEE